MNYPANLRGTYSCQIDCKCRDCGERFEVEGTVDLGQAEPNKEPCCPECDSYNVDME